MMIDAFAMATLVMIARVKPGFCNWVRYERKNPINTGVYAGFGGAIIVDYAEVEKSSKGSYWQECCLAIASQLQNLG
jgi:hypothetical protein